MKNLFLHISIMLLLLVSCNNSSPAKSDADVNLPTDGDMVDEGGGGNDDALVDGNDTSITDDDIAGQDDADGLIADVADTILTEDNDGLEDENDSASEDKDESIDDTENEDADIPVAENDMNDIDASDLDEPTDIDIPDEMPDSDGRYVIQGDVVIDNFRGLMWQKGNSAVMSQYDAITYCENLDVNGWLDWRLPTLSELRMIIEGCYYTSPPEFTYYCEANDACLSQSCGSGTCNCTTNLGPSEDGSYCEPGIWDDCDLQLWSSSLVYDHDSYAWTVYYSRAWVREWNRNLVNTNARCVRDI